MKNVNMRRSRLLLIVVSTMILSLANLSYAKNDEVREQRGTHKSHVPQKIKFQIIGTLDAIHKDSVVVDDSSYPLRNYLRMNHCKVGDYVGLQINKENEVIAIMHTISPP
ncbi:MAG: hypothetical protein B6I36_11250 [Desulfobacteraceae bacterium 4572_35.1]|nr:MAG: hypothetical protein B6I36_11250 [Desulfobacteraceae bacterium 4572_35.1]